MQQAIVICDGQEILAGARISWRFSQAGLFLRLAPALLSSLALLKLSD